MCFASGDELAVNAYKVARILGYQDPSRCGRLPKQWQIAQPGHAPAGNGPGFHDRDHIEPSPPKFLSDYRAVMLVE